MNAMNRPQRLRAMLAATAAALVFASNAVAYVTTDQFDYPPGSTVTFLGDNSDGVGYIPGETVIVDVAGPNGYASWCEGAVIGDGSWWCQVVLPTEDAAGDYAYIATGQISGVSESGMFKDAILTFFEDAAHTIQRNAFAWGETVYARGTNVNANRCARIEWFEPGNATPVETDEVVADGSGVITAEFDIPATDASGIWSAKIQNGSKLTPCDGTGYTTVNEQTQVFDVARVVIIGAGDPSTITADSAGGDNFVAQGTPTTVQQSGGLGTTLSVDARSSLAKRTFLQFDIAGAGIPAAADVTDAKLRLFMTKSPTASGCVPRNYDLETAATTNVPWAEGTVTWNTQPGVTGAASTVAINDLFVPPFSYIRFDVDDHVQDFVDGTLTNYGWRLKDRSETFSGVNCDSNFFSTESNQTPTVKTNFWPVLLIDYELALPPLVTSGGRCLFDVNENRDLDQFRLIFTPDQPNSTSSSPRWKLNASNPGQFAFNVFVEGTPGEEETVTITLPRPFVTQGANPVRVFDDFSIVENGKTCIVPGNQIAATASPATVGLADYTGSTTDVEVTFTFPASGIAYITIHLDYGWKHVASSCYPDNKTNVNVTCTLPAPNKLIPNHAEYEFSFSNGQSGSYTVENENVVKNDPGIAGLVLQQGTNNPLAGVKVEIFKGTTKVATVYTDADGWYQWVFKYTGKATTFVVKLPTYGVQSSVTMKSNAYVIVNFSVP